MHADKQTQKYKHTKPGINWTTRNNTSTTYLKSHDGDILTTMNFLYIVTIFETRVEFLRFVSIYNFYGVFWTKLLLTEILLVSGQSSP